MNRFFPIAILSLLAASTAASAAERDLLAHASVDRVWVAVVTQTDPSSPRTDILLRDGGVDKPWQKLATIPDRTIALASRSSQLAVLLSDGRWQSIWASDGASTGTPLPAAGRMLTLTDDGQSLWAIGSVHGGLAVAQAAAVAAATQPTTAATTEPAQPISRPDLPPRLVLFHQSLGRWLPIADLPAGAGDSTGTDVSLAIVGDQPMIAFKAASGAIQISRFSTEHGWGGESQIPAALVDFQLIGVAKVPVLYTNPGKGAGSLYSNVSATNSFIDLSWPDNTVPQSLPAIATVGTTFAVFGVHGNKLYEQRYDPDGKPLGSVVAVIPVDDNRDTSLAYWIDAALMLALGVSVVATLYRRGEQLRRTRDEIITPPPPAPQLPRLAAGLVDLLPVLVAFGYMAAKMDPTRDPMPQLESVQNLTVYGIAVCIYVLHTTLTEIFTGRTVGKFLFALKTVTIEGDNPHVAQLLIRNLLRIIDLLWFPLTLVLISPLRQRSADVAAGTMVIRNKPLEPEPGDETAT